MNTLIPLLPAHDWETSYRHDDGDLVEQFYIPALACAVRYDRLTGYFTADALALAARGLERLIHNWGKMRLVVGCTLGPEEVKAIEEGYAWHEQIAEVLGAMTLVPPDLRAREGLEALAWMIAHERLEIKVAVPVDPATRQPVCAPGIFHEKVGVITDIEGNAIGFSGSINETRGGWVNNRESFHVHCSWEGGREWKHVSDEVEAFGRLWEDRSVSVRTLDFPEAAKARLLEFLPTNDRFTVSDEMGRRVEDKESGQSTPQAPPAEVPPATRLTADEVRVLVWTFIKNAARMPNGIRVGEVTSAVRPWPHQLRTFVRMHANWPFRLLLSDEVGLGKTISAGLIIRQAWLSSLARRIMIMVPAGVMIQWQNELYEKFNLNVPIYDGQKLAWKKTHGWQGPSERKTDRKEWLREPLVLCSSHLMRRRDRAGDLLEAEDWDLLVLDEAHHARRRGAGTAQESGPNQLLRLMQALEKKSRSLLLMTATPMQVHPVEVWDLLNLLGLPERWDSHSFVRYFELAAGNPGHPEMEMLAEMFRATEAAFGEVSEQALAAITPDISRLGRRKVLKALRDGGGIPLRRLDTRTRAAALELLRRFSPIRHRMSRHTRSLLRLYYNKGLLETPIATREVRDVPVELSPAERALYEAVEDYITNTYNNAAENKRNAIGFVMTIYRRRLASCFQALRHTLAKHLENITEPVDQGDLSQDELVESVMDADEAAALTRAGCVAVEKEAIMELLRRIAQLGTDTKARRLKEELTQALADGYDSAIVFSQYADTMDYLKEYLAQEMPEIPIAFYSGDGGGRRDRSGGWSPMTKEQIKNAFREKRIRMLICTDAAGEGLNLQFCGVLVNYDLPWNPMKVEQRIGRIDRIGQKHATIRLINLAYKDTVEADVYFALGQRINIFQGIVGKLQPILSRLPREFERIVLESAANKEAAKHRFLADLEQMVERGDDKGFDIDEVAIEAVDMPELPAPPLTLKQIEAAMNLPNVRPANMVWEKLDPGSYATLLPGMAQKIRVATDADVFDQHIESLEFYSPGGQLFNEIQGSLAPDSIGPGKFEVGKFRVCEGKRVGDWRLVEVRDGESRDITGLQNLLEMLAHATPRQA
ncbi:MAG: SNF2-related protein [bacterium]|nr:SNF2-related protein [bacterium]